MNSKIIQLFTFLVLGGIIAWLVAGQLNSPKIGFIAIQDVYAGFDLKKDMEKKYISVKSLRQKVLDSLAFDLKLMGRAIESQKKEDKNLMVQYQLKREEFLKKKNNFEEDNHSLTSQYDEQILTQLNQYVKDFGKEKNYTYILGNDGNGSLMYGNESRDITKEVTEYINAKYKGIK